MCISYQILLCTSERLRIEEHAVGGCSSKYELHLQGQIEGGFMGRTNKLVDGCYSFWQGGLFPLLQRVWPEYLAQTQIPGMSHLRLLLCDSTMSSRCRVQGRICMHAERLQEMPARRQAGI